MWASHQFMHSLKENKADKLTNLNRHLVVLGLRLAQHCILLGGESYGRMSQGNNFVHIMPWWSHNCTSDIFLTWQKWHFVRIMPRWIHYCIPKIFVTWQMQWAYEPLITRTTICHWQTIGVTRRGWMSFYTCTDGKLIFIFFGSAGDGIVTKMLKPRWKILRVNTSLRMGIPFLN